MPEKRNNLTYVVFMSIIMAFLGFVIENISLVISHGYIDSRYNMFPFIPSYSLIVFIWYYFYVKKNDLLNFANKTLKLRIIYNLLLYLVLVTSVFIIEIVSGNLINIIFHVELWSYKNIALHVTNYANVFVALGFGLMAMILIKLVFPKLFNLLKDKANPKLLRVFNYILGSLMILDTIIFWLSLIVYNKTNIFWKIILFSKS